MKWSSLQKEGVNLLQKDWRYLTWKFGQSLWSSLPLDVSLLMLFNTNVDHCINRAPKCANHRHLKIIDCLTARVFFISTVNSRSKKKKKRSLFCAALVAGTINKLEQSILRLRYLWCQHPIQKAFHTDRQTE